MDLDFASFEMRDDKDVVLEAVSKNRYALFYASERLRDDKEVVLEAVRYNENALDYASERLKDDKDVVLGAVKDFGNALFYASERLKDDKEVVLEAVQRHGYALKFVSKRLKDDKEVVLQAVKKYGNVLGYASMRLQLSLHLGIIASTTPSPELLKDVMSFVSNAMENGNSEDMEYLDIELSDALSFFAMKHPSMFDDAERIVAFIHNPKGSLFQTHTRQKFEQTFCIE